jgi:glucosamine-6-phosphate deaminase
MTTSIHHTRIGNARVLVFDDPLSASIEAANQIEAAITNAKQARGRAVIGLATGSTPIKVYSHLIDRHRAAALSFRDVTAYNLDEYYPISPLHPLSYRYYMHENLLRHIDLDPNHAHIPDGTVPEAFVNEHAAAYDRWIEADGGLDLQLLGIGRNGHIGFNEPTDLPVNEALDLPTRLVSLHEVTIADAVREFGTAQAVIPRALTMGVRTILQSRAILMLATGPAKADAVAAALLHPMTAALPASLLQSAGARVTWIIDRPAAAGLGSSLDSRASV